MSNKDGVEDPPKSILFRMLFKIHSCSLLSKEKPNALRVACTCAIAMTIASSPNVKLVVVRSARTAALTEALCGYGYMICDM